MTGPTITLEQAIQMIESERMHTFYRYPAMNSAVKHALSTMYNEVDRLLKAKKPMTTDELAEIKEPIPVFIQSKSASETGWHVCNGIDPVEDDLLIFDYGQFCHLIGSVRVGNISIYRNDPKIVKQTLNTMYGTANMSSDENNRDELSKYQLQYMRGEMIHIEFIGDLADMPDIYAPYYGNTERYVNNTGTSSERLELDDYGITWLAYATKQVAEAVPPLHKYNYDELAHMNGQPVFVVPLENPDEAEWCIISAGESLESDDNDEFIALIPATDESWYSSNNYGEGWLAYNTKAERNQF